MIRLDYLYPPVLFETYLNGLPTDADVLPTAELWRNGSVSAVPVTVVKLTTGVYTAQWTTLGEDEGWAETDHIQLRVKPIIDGKEFRKFKYDSSGVELGPPTTILPPVGVGKSNGWLLCYGERNDLVAGVAIRVKTLKGPGDSGFSYDGQPFTEISVSNGLVQFPYLVQGSTCIAWRGDNEASSVRFTVPVADNFALPEILSRP